MFNARSFIIMTICLFVFSAAAEIPGLTSAYTSHLLTTRNLIVSNNLLNEETPKTCHQQILNIAQDNIIKITLAFGYMDVTGGQDFNDSGTNLYKNGDVLDINAKNALENILLSKCQGQISKVCGFRRSGGFISKTITNRFTGKRLEIKINLIHPAVSAVDAHNRSNLWKQQEASSQNTQSQFLNSVLTDDVVVYLGHARSGGGPDFFPPVLRANGTVDYGFYQKNRTGIKNLISYLNHSTQTAPIIGLLACKSTGLFSNSVKKASPHSILITASDLFDYNDILPTGYALLEAIINQRCTEVFERVVKVQPKSAHFLKISF